MQKNILENNIWQIDTDIFNTFELKDILFKEYDNLKIIWKWSSKIKKKNLSLFDLQIHSAYNKTCFDYQQILLKYTKTIRLSNSLSNKRQPI